MAYFAKTDFFFPVIRGDSAYYLIYGLNLAQKHTFSKDRSDLPQPDSYWAPGWPMLIAIVSMVSSADDLYMNIVWVNTLLGVLTVLLTLQTARLFLSEMAAFIAAMLVAISPHLVSINPLALTETLFAFVLICLIYLFSLYLHRGKIVYSLLSAAMFGVSYLVNPVVLFTPFLLLPAMFNNIDYRISRRVAVLFIGIFLVFPAGWALRNYISVHKGAGSIERLSTNIIIGSHRDYYDIYRKNPKDPNNPATLDQRKYGSNIYDFLKELSKRIWSSPIEYMKWYLMNKPALLWGWDIQVGFRDIWVYPVKSSLYHKNKLSYYTYVIEKILHGWLVIFAVLSIIFSAFVRRKGKRSLVPVSIYLILVYVSAVYIVTQSDGRYSIPLRPEMYILAMYFIENTIRYFYSVYNKKSSLEGYR